jgi:hypothetical protein
MRYACLWDPSCSQSIFDITESSIGALYPGPFAGICARTLHADSKKRLILITAGAWNCLSSKSIPDVPDSAEQRLRRDIWEQKQNGHS